MKKKVYICAPLGGNVQQNLERAIRFAKYALRSGVAPVVPHFYALCLDDADPKQREIGMSAGLSLLWFCDEMWIFGDEITDGMREEIRFGRDTVLPKHEDKNKADQGERNKENNRRW